MKKNVVMPTISELVAINQRVAELEYLNDEEWDIYTRMEFPETLVKQFNVTKRSNPEFFKVFFCGGCGFGFLERSLRTLHFYQHDPRTIIAEYREREKL